MWLWFSTVATAAEWAAIGCLLAGLILLALCQRQGLFSGAVTTAHGARHKGPQSTALAAAPGPAFLFDGETLIDANADAQHILAQVSDDIANIAGLCRLLQSRFPRLEELIRQRGPRQLRFDSPAEPGTWLALREEGDTLRLSLHQRAMADPKRLTRSLLADIRAAELRLLQSATDAAPFLIWQEDQHGQVSWANPAFASLQDQNPRQAQALLAHQTPQVPGETQRLCIAGRGGDDRLWYDVTTCPKPAGRLCFAAEATEVMQADADRREFVQTLGKTFAQLSIGLAIFDKNRRLVMFNPALMELTTLPPEFLSNRPRIDTVLDRLREMQMMPEPPDYASWREQFVTLETGAKAGSYCENWALPDGRTYRVTGRPHPNGAFALLFEDISAEISLTRRFRSDIETSQAVLDTLPEAIAVFSAAGTLVMSNRAYAGLWALTDMPAFQHREIRTEMNLWQDACVPTPIWGRLRDVVGKLGQREPWSDMATLLDGRPLHCRAAPLTGGMVMVRFELALTSAPRLQQDAPTAPALALQRRTHSGE